MEDTAVINKVILVGNLTRDAEAVPTSGKAMSRMRLATNAQWKDSDGNRQQASEFHTVVSYGRLAEIVALYGTKGRRCYVEGRLRTREYVATDGLRRMVTEIVAETVKLLGARPAEDEAPETADAVEGRA